ncbi:hypothetical protein E2562_033560 [Oryza meyeriana var. granulata]|uniref:DYW domain-containing protein n=1 Tax=Oryza meyeriana var. granulata TaxID=110450 RepID=A0A6G1ES79_9ORYZ|nr:hypothetical protein E2562_033560 [Oryza meyeriana var. granulata]
MASIKPNEFTISSAIDACVCPSAGYAQHGYSLKAIGTFRQIEAWGMEMDDVTFLVVIIGWKWKERDEVRKLVDSRKVKKEAGCSWIQIKNKVHSFIAFDKSHPMSDQIYAKLKAIITRLKQEGYSPNTSFVLHDIAEDQKEAMLVAYSERLALAFGLIATPRGTPL